MSVGAQHEITLVSRAPKFTFYPGLVQLAFGKCDTEDIVFDLKHKLDIFNVRFIEAEVIEIREEVKEVTVSGDDVEGKLNYDYLIVALGRRLATEQVPGFFEFSSHLLGVKSALRYGEAVEKFEKGKLLVGLCRNAKLPVGACETAFALARKFAKKMKAGEISVEIVFPGWIQEAFAGARIHHELEDAFAKHGIKVTTDFEIAEIKEDRVIDKAGNVIETDLMMLVPPFKGQNVFRGARPFLNERGFIKADHLLQVEGLNNVFAAGDNVDFPGPKMGHMAVRQGKVAAENLVALLAGKEPEIEYKHEIAAVIDQGGRESIYLHYGVWDGVMHSRQHGMFWSWAKRIHDSFWVAVHR
jgi:sulfide:quinone oxidoreductase